MLSVFVSSVDVTTLLESALDTAVSVSVGVGSTVIEVQSEKPLGKLYWDFSAAHDGVLNITYYNGTSFVAVVGAKDSTSELTQSGWTTWEIQDDEEAQADLYSYRFTISGVTTLVTGSLRFVGIVFSKDSELKKEYPNLLDYLPSGDTSFIRFHVAAKDDLVQFFRAKGNATISGTLAKNLTEFDFLEPSELSQAAKYYALSKIFFWLSDATDDKYYQKYRDYRAKAEDAGEVYYLSLDNNRDGKASESETLNSTELVIRRG